jgi:hypothetical protein
MKAGRGKRCLTWAILLAACDSRSIDAVGYLGTDAGSDAGGSTPDGITITVDRTAPLLTSALSTGATHTQYSLDSFGNSAAVTNGKRLLQASTVYQNQHVMGWGAENPEISPGNFDWRTMDGRVQIMRDTNGVKVITLCAAPDWMKGGQAGSTDWSKIEVAPLPAHHADFAELARQTALRYPDVLYFQVWNNLKGMYLGPPADRWDYERYTNLYNAVYDALKSVNPNIQVGGPYVLINWLAAGASDPTSVSGPSGVVDQRSLDVLTYWLANHRGADFIAISGRLANKDVDRVDDFTAAHKFVDIVRWIRRQPGRAATLPIWWSEWFAEPFVDEGNAPRANALMAWSLAEILRGGAAVALLWGPQGRSDGSSIPLGLFTDTRNSGGGQPTLFQATATAFKTDFGPGTAIYPATSSSPLVKALASRARVLLINSSADELVVNVGATATTLPGYAVQVVATP